MIPRIIHFVWIGSEQPEWVTQNISEFSRLNPDHKIMVHDATSLLPKYRHFYERCEMFCQKSDILRYSIMEHYSGWYFDVDYWPLRPLSEAENAFMLDGSKLFLAHSGRKSGLNGAVLACDVGWDGWDDVPAILETMNPANRTAYGPIAINALAKAKPEKVVISNSHWFNGVDVPIAPAIYRKVTTTGNHIMLKWIPATGGQLPYAFHLWAGTNGGKLDNMKHDGKPYSVVYGMLRREVYPWDAICDGMKALGYNAECKTDDDALHDIPDVAFIWNGLRERKGKVAAECRRLDSKLVFLEHGFFDRQHYCQADYLGILHNAAWVKHISEPAPDCGAARLRRFYPDGLVPVKHRRGYVLVLGQVPGDTQMLDSEIRGPIPLQRVLFRAFPDNVKRFFRPHPLCSNVRQNRMHKHLPRMETDNQVRKYKANKHGGDSLQEALKGAMFVITINSNAITEALALGVPVLAFGPSTGIQAGAVKPTTIATVRDDIKEMCRGWVPPQEKVRNYLEWLAARQWNVDEFSDSALLQQLIDGKTRIEIPAESGVEELAPHQAHDLEVVGSNPTPAPTTKRDH